MAPGEWIRCEHEGRRPVLRILHIAAPVPAGGLERVVQGLAVGHHRRGHSMCVAAILMEGTPPHPVVAALKDAGVAVEEIHVRHRAYLRERRAIESVCRRFRPDIVHTHGLRPDVLDRQVAARLGIATATTVHGPSLVGGLKGAFYEWLQRRSYRQFDAVVAVSAALRDTSLADGVDPKRLHHIPNAWGGLYEPLSRSDARRVLGLSDADCVVGWVGRMIPVKGGDLFLDALSRLPASRPLAVMIGVGMERERLRERCERLGLTDHVRFYHDITDAGRLFAAFDTYVLSSRSEGVPVVVLEAMAAGTPIVATRVGGVPDTLRDRDAWLVPPEDPGALASGIAESLRDRANAANRAASASRRLSTDFGPDLWLDRYEAVYRSILW